MVCGESGETGSLPARRGASDRRTGGAATVHAPGLAVRGWRYRGPPANSAAYPPRTASRFFQAYMPYLRMGVPPPRQSDPAMAASAARSSARNWSARGADRTRSIGSNVQVSGTRSCGRYPHLLPAERAPRRWASPPVPWPAWSSPRRSWPTRPIRSPATSCNDHRRAATCRHSSAQFDVGVHITLEAPGTENGQPLSPLGRVPSPG